MKRESMQSWKRRLVAFAAAMVVGLVAASPAMADTNGSAQTTVTGGTLSASLNSVTLSSVTYSYSSATTATGTFALTVDDQRGTGEGWNITFQSSAFTSGSNTIAAVNFSLTTIGDPQDSAGQARSSTAGQGPNKVTPSAMTLDTAREVIDAGVGYGQGRYTQSLGVSLNVPALTKAGTYSATVTVTSLSGPGT